MYIIYTTALDGPVVLIILKVQIVFFTHSIKAVVLNLDSANKQ